MKKSKGMLIAFVTPAVLLFCAVFVYPMARTILMSFFKIDGITDSIGDWTFVGLGNFTKLFETGLFKVSMYNLFRIWLFGGIIVMTLALLFAVIITSGIRGKKFYRAIIYMPNIVSAVALATMWLQFVYNPQYGLLKGFCASFGLPDIKWLDASHKFWALLIAYCFGMVGYHMLIFTSGIERIGQEYYEAATIDGANKIGQFRYITLPLLKGVFKTNLTMWSVSTAAFFVWSQLFSTVTADSSTITPAVYLYNQVFGAGNAMTERNSGLAAAVGVLLCICIVFIFWILEKVLKDDGIEF